MLIIVRSARPFFLPSHGGVSWPDLHRVVPNPALCFSIPCRPIPWATPTAQAGPIDPILCLGSTRSHRRPTQRVIALPPAWRLLATLASCHHVADAPLAPRGHHPCRHSSSAAAPHADNPSHCPLLPWPRRQSCVAAA